MDGAPTPLSEPGKRQVGWRAGEHMWSSREEPIQHKPRWAVWVRGAYFPRNPKSWVQPPPLPDLHARNWNRGVPLTESGTLHAWSVPHEISLCLE